MIVTGAAGTIGAAVARSLAGAGMHLCLADSADDAATRRLAALAAELASHAQGVATIAADVARASDAAAIAAKAIAEFGRIDVLVNVAGVTSRGHALDISEAEWDRVLGVNLKGTFLCCQAVLPTMVAKKYGRIVNIASTAALRMTFFGSIDYTVSKHGVGGLTQHLAWEVADHRITVNTVCPGGVLTPLMEEGTTPEFRDHVSRRLIPLGRMCTIEEIGEAVSFLASDRATMITGQMLAVDGGLLTGFGEDLRVLVRKRMAEQKAKHS